MYIYIYIYIYIYTWQLTNSIYVYVFSSNPSACDTKFLFKRSAVGLNSEFSFLDRLLNSKESDLPF